MTGLAPIPGSGPRWHNRGMRGGRGNGFLARCLVAAACGIAGGCALLGPGSPKANEAAFPAIFRVRSSPDPTDPGVVIRQIPVKAAIAGRMRRHWLADGRLETRWATFGDTSPLTYDPLERPGEKYWFGLDRGPYEFKFEFLRPERVDGIQVVSENGTFERAAVTVLDGEGREIAALPGGPRPGSPVAIPPAPDFPPSPRSPKPLDRGGGKGRKPRPADRDPPKREAPDEPLGPLAFSAIELSSPPPLLPSPSGGGGHSKDGPLREEGRGAGQGTTSPSGRGRGTRDSGGSAEGAQALDAEGPGPRQDPGRSPTTSAITLRFERQEDPRTVWVNEVGFYSVAPRQDPEAGRPETVRPAARGIETGLVNLPASGREETARSIRFVLAPARDYAGPLDIQVYDPIISGLSFPFRDAIPFSTARAWSQVRLWATLRKGERLRLTLDIPDLVLPGNEDLEIAIRGPRLEEARSRITIEARPPRVRRPGSAATLESDATLSDWEVFAARSQNGPVVDLAIRECLSQHLLHASGEYSIHAEPRRWWRDMDRPGTVWAVLEEVLRLDPGNERAHAMYDRLHHSWPEKTWTLEAPEGAPEWAVYLRETLRYLDRVADHVCDKRADADGQLGGSLGDDPALASQLVFVHQITGSPGGKIPRMARKLAELQWTSGRLEKGLPTGMIEDLLHVSDETAECQPPALVLDYGDPELVERCMETFREFFGPNTAVNAKGHRHFTRWTGTSWKENRRMRAAAPGFSLLWYARYETALSWLQEYYDGWLEHEGKRTDCPEAGWKDFRGSAGDFDLWFLLALYLDTRDPKYLEPLRGTPFGERLARFEGLPGPRIPAGGNAYPKPLDALYTDRDAEEKDVDDEGKPPRLEAAREGAAIRLKLPSPNPGFFTSMREDLPFLAFLKDGDRARLAGDLRRLLAGALLVEFDHADAEIPTDRIYPRGCKLLPELCLGGPSSVRGSYPYLAASYEGLGTDVVPLVLGNNDGSLRILFWSFASEPRKGSVRVWELDHGEYRVRAGRDEDQDGVPDAGAAEWTAELKRADAIPIEIPPRTPFALECYRLKRRDAVRLRPDLALTSRDLRVEGGRLLVRVHNIGASPVPLATVEARDGAGRLLGRASIRDVAAPHDLVPKTQEVAIPLPEGYPGGGRVVLDPEGRIPEIFEGNNEAPIPLNAAPPPAVPQK